MSVSPAGRSVESSGRIVLPHIVGSTALLGLLGLVSASRGSWGYFALYARVLTALGIIARLAWAGLRFFGSGLEGPARARRFLRTSLRSFVYAQLTLGSALAAVALVARLGSGPIGPFPGGPFRGRASSGPLADVTALDAEEVQLQIPAEPPYTITTHAFLIDGSLYVGADFVFPFKRWVYIVQEEPELLVRVGARVPRVIVD